MWRLESLYLVMPSRVHHFFNMAKAYYLRAGLIRMLLRCGRRGFRARFFPLTD